MEKSNYKEWSVDFNGKTIKVSNWWNSEGKGSADLYLDDVHLDQNTDILVNPNKAMFSKREVSDDIKSIEVFLKHTQKKLKEMDLFKFLKKEVETGASGTQSYVIKKGPNKDKIAKK